MLLRKVEAARLPCIALYVVREQSTTLASPNSAQLDLSRNANRFLAIIELAGNRSVKRDPLFSRLSSLMLPR